MPRGMAPTGAADLRRQQATKEILSTAESVSAEARQRENQAAERVNQELSAEAEAAEGAAQQQSVQEAKDKPMGPGEVAAEAGGAVFGGGIDAMEAIGATAEQVLTGNMMNAQFKPTWLQVADEDEPMTRTIWGGLIRGVSEYGILAVLTRKAASGAKALRVPGTTALSKALQADRASSQSGTITRTAVKGAATGAAADFMGSYAQGDTISTELKKLMPWMPTPLATDNDDSPLERRVKNVVEGVGLGLAADFGFAYLRAKSVAKDAPVPKEEQLAKYQELERSYNKTTRELTKRAIIHKTGLGPDELTAQFGKDWHKSAPTDMKLSKQDLDVLRADPEYRGLEEAAKQFKKDYTDLDKQLNPKGRLEEKIRSDADSRQANFDEKVKNDLADDPEGLIPSAFVNAPLFDRPDKALFTPAKSYFQNLRASYLMETDPIQAAGRRPSVYTESALEKRLSQFDPERRKIIEEVAKGIDVELNELAVREGKGRPNEGFSSQQLRQLSAARYIDLLDDVVDDVDDLEPLRRSLTEGAVDPRDRTNVMTGTKERFLGLVDHKAVEMLIHTTAGEISELATAATSIHGVMDTSRQLDGLLNRMKFMLSETGRAKYISGFDLAGLKANSGEMPARLRQIDTDVDAYIKDLRKVFNEDPEMLIGYLEALKMADGMPKAFDEMYKFAKKRFDLGFESLIDPASKSEFVKQLQAVAINSVLSGPRTIGRAFMGNAMMVFMRPMQASLGGLISGDPKGFALGMAGLKTAVQAVPEAWRVAGISRRANIGTASPTAILDRSPDNRFVLLSEDWQNLGRIVEAGPEVAPKIMYRLTDNLYSFNRWIGSNYPQLMMTQLDDMTGAIMGRMDAKMRAFNKAWDETGGKDMGELTKKYEKEFYSLVFKEDDGPILISEYARRLSQEASLRLPMPEQLKPMENMFNNVPVLKPFFLFAKTGYNALDVVKKHTPILGTFNDEYRAIMSATPENMDKVRLYGINDPGQLFEAQMVMKGRLATGYLTVSSAIGLYLAGNLTGNGPPDREQRNLWMQTGWQPRSIRIPGSGKYISYDSLEPFTSFLSLVADIGDNTTNLGETATQNMLAKVGGMIANNLTNKSFLQGITDLNDILSMDPNRSANWLANLANNQLPWAGARRAIANLIDPGMRELDNDFQSTLKTISNANPVFKGALPVKYDILDGSIVREADPITRLFNFVSPVSINFVDTPTRRMLRETGYDIAKKFSRDSSGNKLDPEKRSRMQKLISEENLEKSLGLLFQKPEIRKEMNAYYKLRQAGVRSRTGKGADEQYGLDVQDTKFYNAIETLFTQAQKRAEARLYQEYPNLRRAAVERRAIEMQQKEGRPGAAIQRTINYALENQ